MFKSLFNSAWYNSLAKPPFAPPSWVFAPAWSFLYGTIFIALVLYTFSPALNKKSGYVYFLIQLIFNFLWVPAFFGVKNMLLALFVIILTVIFTFLTVRKFYSASRVAGLLLLPYFFWLIYAAYLNFGYLFLNYGTLMQ